MILKRISILNYKNLEQAELEFSPKMDCFIGQKNRESRQQIRHTKHHTFVHILISQTIKERVMMVSMQIGLMINRMNFLTV